MKIQTVAVPVFALLLISACGGGSSSNGIDTNTDPEETPPVNLLTGRFVDSAVTGLQYTTPSQSGLTGSDGSFNYESGESVTFSIGDIVLPAIPGADIITPLSVFSTDDITDLRVMNLARLLQTLDDNADPSDGIVLADSAVANATGLQVDFSSANFVDQVNNLVANSGSSNTELVNAIEALDHLQETLFVEGIDERPPLPSTVDTPVPTGTENSATHPSVGASAEFSNLAHDISGTLTVIDDRTLQVTNFNYDGGGVVVYFYTGTDGNYRDGDPGAGPIGPQLNGRRYVNETITLTIPSNLTLDDFNGVSVWCVPFSANFGDARL
ncbi:MAG: DM13 domain-containing protein [Granulosicoccus sp.]|nr:DM13 domain-containing protein [Granulosicoccus sp.]